MPKPLTIRRVSTVRETRYTMPVGEVSAAIIIHLRRHHNEFRGFTNDEIDLTFSAEGDVEVVAYKETTK